MKLFNRARPKRHLDLPDELTAGQHVLVFTWEIFKVVVISLAIIIPVRYFLIKPFYVKGASMEPNFHDYEYLIIDELTYRFNEPQRGDVVVFRYPLDRAQFFIKRVVGLPGETITIGNGQVYITSADDNSHTPLFEPYLAPATRTSGDAVFSLGSDEYLLLGDNRGSSLDSRYFGPVKSDDIVGRTLLRGWPLNRAGLLLNDVNYSTQ